MLRVVHEHDGQGGPGEFGDELLGGEGEDGFGIGDLLGDFASGVEGVGGGDDGTQGHHSEAHHGEEDRVRGQQHDDVAFPDAHVGEARRDGVDGPPKLVEGEVAAGGSVDEGDSAGVGPRRYEGGDIH